MHSDAASGDPEGAEEDHEGRLAHPQPPSDTGSYCKLMRPLMRKGVDQEVAINYLPQTRR
jgi:hypothetical protein